MTKEATARWWTPRNILLVSAMFVFGAVAGLAIYTFVYAKGLSYLSTDPDACINCHIMEEQYDSWLTGSHHNTATCSDCHMPHDNFFHKYYVKAENGFWHALKFTTGDHPENIVARPVSKGITNQACLYCHADFTEDVRHPGAGLSTATKNEDEIFDCIRCHSDVGHD